jgi:putative CocE/NonD family hydrolase
VRSFGAFEAPSRPWVIWDELWPTQPQGSPPELPALPGPGFPGVPAAVRKDVLWYQTAPLREDLTVAGDVTAVLWVSSSAPDTDFVVKLLDVHPPSADYPTGYALLLSNGLLRARYREGFATPKPMAPGEVYRLEIPIDPVANRFCAGHRIAVCICSSNFPDSDINRNTGGDPLDRRWQTADNTIHHNREHPSHIMLSLWEEPERQ